MEVKNDQTSRTFCLNIQAADRKFSPKTHSFYIRTSIFRIELGPFLLSGQFQPRNVLTDVLKLQ